MHVFFSFPFIMIVNKKITKVIFSCTHCCVLFFFDIKFNFDQMIFQHQIVIFIMFGQFFRGKNVYLFFSINYLFLKLDVFDYTFGRK